MAFNYASQALNNAFFLSHLVSLVTSANASLYRAWQLTNPHFPSHLSQSPDPQASQDLSDESWQDRSPPQPEGTFKGMLENHFGSVTEFKSAFSAAALGMSSSGWVWLVVDGQGKAGIVPTYGAGTVLVQNRLQRGLPDIESSAATSSPDGTPASTSDSLFAESSGALKSHGSAKSLKDNGDSYVTGTTLHPLLCLSVHEHAWLPDWGIWGKENYLARFWEVVDWKKVGRVRDAYMNKGII